MSHQISVRYIASIITLFFFIPHADAAFSDVPSSHFASEAITYLQQNGIVQGYSDGTFKPDKILNRAEAIKFIIAPIADATTLQSATSTSFNDVPAGDWSLPFIEYARKNSVIDGPPKKPGFLGANPVTKSEYLKMLILSHKLNPGSYSEIRLPLGNDVTNPDEWFYPYMRYAISSSMIQINKEGMLLPNKALTRAEAATFLHRLLMYKKGLRIQALLSVSETEIINVLNSIEKNDILQAEYASARALVSARGAHASKADNPTVLAALKITEAFRALVRSYRAGLNLKFDDVIALAGDAWHLAEKARTYDPNVTQLSKKVQEIAGKIANDARALKAKIVNQ